MRSEELTLAHHVFVDEVLRSFGVCHGAVKIACVCQFTETVSVMERELRAPHVILFRVSFRSWLRQPLCQSSATALRRKESISVCVYTSIFGGQQIPQAKSKAKARASSQASTSEGAEAAPDTSPPRLPPERPPMVFTRGETMVPSNAGPEVRTSDRA